MTARAPDARDLAKLHTLQPELRGRALRVYHRAQADIAAQHGCLADLGTCYRDPERQAKLWKRGRELRGGQWFRTGRVVTNARPWESAHCYGFAFHIVLVEPDRSRWLLDRHPAWEILGGIARDEGLVWGGDWKAVRDCAHIEMPEWRTYCEEDISESRRQWQKRGW